MKRKILLVALSVGVFLLGLGSYRPLRWCYHRYQEQKLGCSGAILRNQQAGAPSENWTFTKYCRYMDCQLSTSRDTPIIFFGDSLIEMWQLPVYFRGRFCINRGIGGQTTQRMADRILQTRYTGYCAVVWIGTNDVGLSSAEILPHLERILSHLSAGFERILVLSLPPFGPSDNGYWVHSRQNDWQREMNREIARVVLGFQKAVCVNIFDCLIGGGQLDEGCSIDGVHLSARGYDRVSAVVLDHLQK
jgi:hypothetical protein